MPIPLGILAVAGAGAGAASSFDLLETTVLGTAVATVEFSSLGTYSDYKHLQIRFTGRNTGTAVIPYLRVNGITATTGYSAHRLYGNGTSVASDNQSGNGYMSMGIITNSTATTNAFAAGVIDFLDFSNTNKNKTIRAFVGQHGNAAGSGGPLINLDSGARLNTAAITSIQMLPESGTWAIGSRFSLYGIK